MSDQINASVPQRLEALEAAGKKAEEAVLSMDDRMKKCEESISAIRAELDEMKVPKETPDEEDETAKAVSALSEKLATVEKTIGEQAAILRNPAFARATTAGADSAPVQVEPAASKEALLEGLLKRYADAKPAEKGAIMRQIDELTK